MRRQALFPTLEIQRRWSERNSNKSVGVFPSTNKVGGFFYFSIRLLIRRTVDKPRCLITSAYNRAPRIPRSCIKWKVSIRLSTLTLPMSAGRFLTSKSCRCKVSVNRGKEHPAPRGANRVLAGRNPAVVAVGAWVEAGQDFVQHPSVSLAFNAIAKLALTLSVARLLRSR